MTIGESMKINNEIIEWKSIFELGIPDIDYQHHYFFDLIKRLSDELITSNDSHYRSSILSELSSYARFHFISEENFMYKYEYPGMEYHKNLHLELLDKLSAKSNLIYAEDSEKHYCDIMTFLVDWFLGHTTTIDKDFANYIVDRNNAL